MNQGKYVFSQVVDYALQYHLKYQFNKCVEKYKGNYCIKNLTCWEQFLAMTFGQLAYRESLRDVVICLQAQKDKLYHLGFRCEIFKSTLASANEKRDWRIYRDFAQLLIAEARKLYCNDKEFTLDLDGTVYIIDSTTIELCLNIFKWAKLVKARAAVRLHNLMDLNGNIPAFFHITTGKVHDVNFLDLLELEIGAYYIMDKGYTDFKRFYKIEMAGFYFVTRAKINLAYDRLYSHPVSKEAKEAGVRCDQTIKIHDTKKYPDKLRRIKYFDKETKKYYVFLTNNFEIDALIVTELYKSRWQVELFFKWIKQHLKIKSFWGYSANAVKTQICVAICTYLLVAIIRKRLKSELKMYEILQILSVSLFDKTPINRLVSEVGLQKIIDQPQKQQCLWD